ncbi:RICIN domain-containing protein [Actinoplanes regularis]|uniref:RICIN domain-containing protein n=1 Tax=Actinoplanes regularis TaxID=52697 RepID=UPI0024A440E7|nr:RICIN domain-containing protein [Actinoplanes regularis]GLW28319.1 hypothetical protein Areg01_12590 [Actinoplanes regularis]
MVTGKRDLAKAAAVTLATAGVLVAGWASPAAAATSQGTFVWISLRSSGCVDADLNTIGGNGTRVQLWGCNHQSQQNWRRYSDGTIRSSRSGRCLDADTGTIGGNGTRVQLWKCNGSLQQKWTITGPSTASSHRVVSNYSGRCVDADLNTIGRNGTVVQLWDCNSQSQQSWRTLYF